MAFILLIMGTLEFGWAIYSYNYCSFLAQSGARWASTQGSLSTSPATVSSLTAYVQSQMVGMSTSNLTVTPSWCDQTGANCNTSQTSSNTGSPYNTPGSLVNVTIAYTITPLAGLAIKQNINVSSTAQFVINH
jgi:Flp pilus assembly protein TadG